MRNTQAVANNACGSQNLCRWRDPRPPAPPTLHTVRLLKIFVNNPVYLYIYMRGSASRKDDANSLFWLEIKASKKACFGQHLFNNATDMLVKWNLREKYLSRQKSRTTPLRDPTHTSLVSILCSAATIAGAFSYFASSLFYKRDAWLRLLGTLSSQDGDA